MEGDGRDDEPAGDPLQLLHPERAEGVQPELPQGDAVALAGGDAGHHGPNVPQVRQAVVYTFYIYNFLVRYDARKKKTKGKKVEKGGFN